MDIRQHWAEAVHYPVFYRTFADLRHFKMDIFFYSLLMRTYMGVTVFDTRNIAKNNKTALGADQLNARHRCALPPLHRNKLSLEQQLQ